ncbi:oviduct-specific glycoprotein-like isoform X1 [Mya arenaria]|uniref:oviduct-specific glycoprotein-like isoform X1 n=1 Tax=Mya arenaria TaxID=6604 RepID=UPI0022DF2CD7|nr:oviduct-specific glycoprotein-like isoform X1 [Mya arenaria]
MHDRGCHVKLLNRHKANITFYIITVARGTPCLFDSWINEIKVIKKMLLTVTLLFAAFIHGASGFRIVCVYTNWSQYRPGDGKFLPEDVDPTLCTHLIYVYAKLQRNKLHSSEWNDEGTRWKDGMYQRVINLKELNPEMKVLLGVGGWMMGSKDFSRLASRRGSRRVFARSAVKFLRDRKFDGLTIDWQHPTRRGGRPRDRQNYSFLLKEVRMAFDAESKKSGLPPLLLTAGVSASIDVIDTAYEVDNLTRYTDFLNVFAYDLHGAWDNYTGHPSQLYPRQDEFGPATEINVDASMRHWMSLVPDASKLVLGVSTYGRTFTLRRSRHHEYNVPTTGPGVEGEFTRQTGMLAYYERCNQYMDAPRVWDPVSQVAYWYSGDQWIAGEDTDSVRAKVNWTTTYQAGGIMLWSLDTDDFRKKCGNEAFPLLKAAIDEKKAPTNLWPKGEGVRIKQFEIGVQINNTVTMTMPYDFDTTTFVTDISTEDIANFENSDEKLTVVPKLNKERSVPQNQNTEKVIPKQTKKVQPPRKKGRRRRLRRLRKPATKPTTSLTTTRPTLPMTTALPSTQIALAPSTKSIQTTTTKQSPITINKPLVKTTTPLTFKPAKAGPTPKAKNTVPRRRKLTRKQRIQMIKRRRQMALQRKRNERMKSNRKQKAATKEQSQITTVNKTKVTIATTQTSIKTSTEQTITKKGKPQQKAINKKAKTNLGSGERIDIKTTTMTTIKQIQTKTPAAKVEIVDKTSKATQKPQPKTKNSPAQINERRRRIMRIQRMRRLRKQRQQKNKQQLKSKTQEKTTTVAPTTSTQPTFASTVKPKVASVQINNKINSNKASSSNKIKTENAEQIKKDTTKVPTAQNKDNTKQKKPPKPRRRFTKQQLQRIRQRMQRIRKLKQLQQQEKNNQKKASA